ncbi:MAG: YaaR family protein [Bacillota bacterium]
MKISDINNRSSTIAGISGREERRTEIAGSKTSFGDTLRKTEDVDLETRLNRLMSDIERQGESLAKSMDIKDLKQYKKLIAEFMDEVVNSSLKYSKHNQFDRRGRHKVYALVRKVNAKIEEISREFLKEEKDNIKILENIGSIKGMLLDMYM